MRYLLDSGIVNDYAYRRHGVYERARQRAQEGHRLGMGTPVLGELLAGVLASASRARNLPVLERNLAHLTFWPFDTAAARQYARLWAELRASGRAVQVPDLQIAAIALSLGDCIVVSKDGDLRAVPGLTVEDWSQP
jgi:predicted nucleic acid-binding protein